MLDALGGQHPHVVEKIFDHLRDEEIRTLLTLRMVNRAYKNWVDTDTVLWPQLRVQKIQEAIFQGQADIFHQMTAQLEDKNVVIDHRGYTCLHLAAALGQFGIAQIILNGTQNKNPASLEAGRTPLHVCASFVPFWLPLDWPFHGRIGYAGTSAFWPPVFAPDEHNVTKICRLISSQIEDNNSMDSDDLTPLGVATKARDDCTWNYNMNGWCLLGYILGPVILMAIPGFDVLISDFIPWILGSDVPSFPEDWTFKSISLLLVMLLTIDLYMIYRTFYLTCHFHYCRRQTEKMIQILTA